MAYTREIVAVSGPTVYRTLRRHGMARLPKKATRREVRTRRCAKTVAEHRNRVDVLFLKLRAADGTSIRRARYTAVDDATGLRALRVSPRHDQETARAFIDEVFEECAFRNHTVRTGRSSTSS